MKGGVRMVEEVYEKLAQKLEGHPAGFPRTETGIELKLLEKIFTPDEAAMAVDLLPRPETIAQITERTGMDPTETGQMLGRMVGKGQIMTFPMGDEQAFIFIPFIVGIYFYQVGSVDEELARLFEEYHRQWAEGVFNTGPTHHRVVAIERSIPVEFEVMPYERVNSILEGGRSFGLFPCMCKLQKTNLGEGCNHPVMSCLIFSPVEGAYDNVPGIQSLTKDEALQTLRDFEEAGLVHATGNFQDGNNYICNCCTCSCTFLRALAEYGIEDSVAKSNFYAVVNDEACDGCEDCIDSCQFDAITVDDGRTLIDVKRCTGCGLCVVKCPTEALNLARKSEEVHTPKNIEEWNQERAQARGS